MAAWARRRGCGLLAASLAALLGRAASEDLTQQMYKAALRSDAMTELVSAGVSGFVGPDRPAGVVAIMFHESSCGICHGALPELEQVASQFKEAGVDISIAHIEASDNKEQLKRRFHLRGFPSFVAFRRRLEAVTEDDRPEALVGKSLKVTADRDYLVRAASNAKMGQERNAVRLKAAGKEGEVLEVDLVDGTALLKLADGKTWFPLEALERPDGAKLPYHRSEASFMYLGAWRAAEMQRFLERMLQPLVVEVEGSSRDAARALVEKDLYPSYFFCGGSEATAGFVEAATENQGKVRSFHVKDLSACPAPVDATSVLVYSPPGQQWAASTKAMKAAVARCGAEVFQNDSALVHWFHENAFPGIMELGYHNFPDFVNSARHGLMVAVRGPRGTGGEVTKLVEKRLNQVGKPEALDPRTDLYTYGPADASYFLAAIDGGLDGLASFGVDPRKLPRVVVFQGRDVWIEDESQLTVETLTSDLQRLPQLWKSMDGPRGWALWLAKNIVMSFYYYHDMSIQQFGPDVGKFIVPIFFGGISLYYLWQLLRLVGALFGSLAQSDEAPAGPPAVEAPPKEGKKTEGKKPEGKKQK